MKTRAIVVGAGLLALTTVLPGAAPDASGWRAGARNVARAAGLALDAWRATAAGAAISREVLIRLYLCERASAPLAPLAPWAGAAAGLGLVSLCVRRQSLKRRVLRHARAGRAIPWIARRVRLSQDAVRSLLAPPVRPEGKGRKLLPTGRTGRPARSPAAEGTLA
jgi:hypothetical protein